MKYFVCQNSDVTVGQSLKIRNLKFRSVKQFLFIFHSFLVQPFFMTCCCISCHLMKWSLLQRFVMNFFKYFHFWTKSVMIDPPYSIIILSKNYQLTEDKSYLDEQPNMSTHNFCHQTRNIPQSKHVSDDHVLHGLTITV